MNLLSVAILSIVEGITEFLPISSTGHLILTTKLLGLPTTEFSKTFDIAIQLGAILAVVVLYFNKIMSNKSLIKNMLIGFTPTALVGFFLYPYIKGYLLGNTTVTLFSLFFGGIVLIFIDGAFKTKKTKNLNMWDYVLIGFFQSLSVVPGVSRAAATIIGGRVMGLDNIKATEFSFLLAIPTMFAATGYDLYKSASAFNSGDFVSLGVGFVLSFVFALATVSFLINFVKRHDFKVFGYYRIALALLFWLLVH